jgi:hypothetical protein
MKPRCHHPKAARKKGARCPALYGSRATTVCGACGKWRLLEVSGAKWEKPPIPVRDDEY